MFVGQGTFRNAGPHDSAFADNSRMTDERGRLRLSIDQVALMNEVLAGAPPQILDAAARIGRGEVVPDDDAEAVAGALVDRMLDRDGFDGEALSARGIEVDDLIGIVQQMSEHFYD
jgi:hypothetical protein